MNCVLVLILIVAVADCSEDKIDGLLLSNKLKQIKEEIGVNDIQGKYNAFRYTTKTETGETLRTKIQSSLDTSMKDLNQVLTNVKNTKNSHDDTTSTSLPRCCDNTGSYRYIPEFRKEVDISTACVTTSPIADNDLKYPPEEIGVTMKTNYEQNRNVLWQRYSTTKGVSIIYPSTYWEDCQNYDPRFTSSYAAATSPTDKDVVIVLDTSSSMKQPSAVPDKTKIVIAKEAAFNVIKTLKPNDRVGIVRFNADASTPSGDGYDSCYQNTLAFATTENTKKIKDFILSTSGTTTDSKNFDNALIAAFTFFHPLINETDFMSRDQVILFVSDGKGTGNPVETIAQQNRRFQNRIMIFTYLIGTDNATKTQMQDMANQVLSVGSIRGGYFQSFDNNHIHLLSTTMATYYIKLPSESHSDSSTFTVPFVDSFSEIGLITSLCLPVPVTSGLHGIACTDVKISELLTEVEYFTAEEFSYAFIIDGTGRTLMHPLLPDADFVKSSEDPVHVDISVLEREANDQSLLESMKRGETGQKSFGKHFITPRGRLVNDGSSSRFLIANFFWGPVPKSNFSLCVVLVDDSYSELDELSVSPSNDELNNVFMYHNRSIISDPHLNCKFYKRRVTTERSCVKFSAAAFSDPFDYLDTDETAEDVSKYKNYLTKASTFNPGFKSTVRAAVWATYNLEKFWKRNLARYVSWRYIATKAGLIRIYPGVTLEKSYDHEKRTWWRQSLAHKNAIMITTPYVDAWGSGIVISFTHTIYKKGTTQVTAVAAADFPLEYFNWFISDTYTSCENGYSCIIINDSGFIVMHPRLKETTDESHFVEPKHITVEEPGIASTLRTKGVLNSNECQDFSKNVNLISYRVTLPESNNNGLDFRDTDESFELRPIADTNLFILRIRSTPSSTCSCDGFKSPDAVECTNECQCLCYSSFDYDVCSNYYDTSSSSLPCSARLPDTSGTSKPDDLRLPQCYNATCYQHQTETTCLGEAECSWCKFTDLGLQIETPCCRLKEECTFGKTKPNNRNTCVAITTPAPIPGPGNQDSSSESTGKIVGIAVGCVAVGVLITLIVIGGVCYFRQRTYTDKTDPYLDAVPDRNELHQYSENEECNNSTPPPPYTSNPNYYVEHSTSTSSTDGT